MAGRLLAAYLVLLQGSLAQDWTEAIRAEVLRAHVSFLASDALEGRDTPSRGLDVAAEYVAAHFRRAGLEAPVADGYFQTATITPETLRLKLDPGWKEAEVHNVVGLLRGSDPALRDEYVLLTAHYDHIGLCADCEGDQVYNGANDNASGVAAMIELAEALAGGRARPRRSIVFIAFWGEEQGLFGSRHYVRNPVFPLDRTVAAISLEVVGVPDQSGRAPITGFDYSDIGPWLAEAGKAAGVEFFRDKENSDAFFNRSDNIVFARRGIPAHTISAGYSYPDYHQLSDHWTNLDYPNMERLARGIAVGVAAIANRDERPRWNADNPRAARYRSREATPGPVQ